MTTQPVYFIWRKAVDVNQPTNLTVEVRGGHEANPSACSESLRDWGGLALSKLGCPLLGS